MNVTVKSYALIDALGKELFRVSGVEIIQVGAPAGGAFLLRNRLGNAVGNMICPKAKLVELPPEKEKG